MIADTAPAVLLAGLPLVVLDVFGGLRDVRVLPVALALLVAVSVGVGIRRRRAGSTTSPA
ncbi:hypothetical protein [Streptomyces sp. NPDC056387]|uniref:hypothetical protein n=1 Tax=Streptomyces sp. NPDC056387 TaxID=3345803 RepID=UPI0035D63A0B